MPRPPRRQSRTDHPDRDATHSGTPPRAGEKISGIFQAIARGGGFVVPDHGDYGDVRIAIAGTGAALHGDHVQVEIMRGRFAGRLGGAVTKVLKHANQKFVGRVSHRGRMSVVVPKNPKIQRNLEIHRRIDPEEVPDGSWIVAEVTKWSGSPHEPLVGRVNEILGMDDDKGLPILLLIRGAGVPDEFPAEVIEEAESYAREPHALPGPKRADFRRDRILTIDPETAKDFDDAIGLIEVLADGWRMGVHIADVAHYVRPGTLLDDEAYARSTSIYPVDRVIPMLPHALSNQLCSLTEGEDKLTMSAVFTVTKNGRVRDVELFNSRIRSWKRLTYEQAQGLFDEADREAGLQPEAGRRPRPIPMMDPLLREDLLTLRDAARALNAARIARGALDLDLAKPQFEFDSEGRPIRLHETERFEAHRLIEEFMVAANEAVARELERRHWPALFRVHEEPTAERTAEIAPALARVGIALPKAGVLTREQLQVVLDAAREHPAGKIVQRWVLRMLKRARYQPENIGHYGLASDSYLHFTSPIRRYPDLVVHRIVKALLAGKSEDAGAMEELRERLPEIGRHTSMREELAQKVEWNAEEIMAMDYMRRYHLGDIFEGYVAGVNPMGFFVALADYPVEGLVRIASIEGEYFDLDEEYHIWRSRQSGRTIAMGDPVSVVIDRIDVLGGQMDLRLVRKKNDPGPRGKIGKFQGKGKFAREKTRRDR